MAINYTTLFTRLGRIVKAVNDLLAFGGTTLPALYDDILDEYEARRDLVPTLGVSGEANARAVQGWVNGLKAAADKTLADLQLDLNAPSASVATILPLLVADMAANSESVRKNGVSAPSVSAGGGNVGSGSLKASVKAVGGVDDERVIDEVVELVCTADQFTGASAAGETFSITGYPSRPAADPGKRGNGTGPSMTVEDANNKLLNGDFETFTVANTPDSWTLGTGAVAGGTVKQETSNVHRGSAALHLDGDGSTTSVTISQTPAGGVLAASTTYAVGVWLRKGGTVTGGSTLVVRVTGTGFSTVNLFNADPATLTTSYVLYAAFINTPANLPSNLKVEVVWSSADTAGALADLYLDDFVVAVPTAFGHVQYAVFAGATAFIKGDVFSVTNDNDYAGVFQTFFGRFYDTALPSVSSSETQADSLAT